jgi:NAD(P)-dependent dehydrogenase (short-subunit alcohol dehydrogenase family)
VTVAEIVEENGRKVAEEITDAGGDALFVPTDVTDMASTEAMVDAALERFGTVDVLINNAAIYYGLELTPFNEISDSEWDRVMAVNVKGVWNSSKAVFPHMRDRGRGRIINVASSVFFLGPPMLLHYVASKGAVVGLTRALAKELGDYGISVIAVAPGLTWTEASEKLVPEIMGDMFVEMQALKRRQQPDDLVGIIKFLCSPESEFITGQTIVVDGGAALH